MLRRGFILGFASVTFFTLSGIAGDDGKLETTETKIKKLGEQLRDVWVDYPTDAQKLVRDTHTRDLGQQCESELAAVDLPVIPTMQKAIDNYLENVDATRQLFKTEKYKEQRQLYIRSCTTALKREFAAAKDYANPRTVYQVFDLMMDIYEKGRDKVRIMSMDIKSEVYGGINGVFTELLSSSTIPDHVDHTKKFDENIKEIRKRFSIKTELEKKLNSAIASNLESAAKSIQQRTIHR